MPIIVAIVIIIVIVLFKKKKPKAKKLGTARSTVSPDQPGIKHFNTMYDPKDEWYAENGVVYYYSGALHKTYEKCHFYTPKEFSKRRTKWHYVGAVPQLPSYREYDADYFNSGSDVYVVVDGCDINKDVIGSVPRDKESCLTWSNYEGTNQADITSVACTTYYNGVDRLFCSVDGDWYEGCAVFLCMMNTYSNTGYTNPWSPIRMD